MKKYTKYFLSGMLALCMMCLGICLTGCGKSLEVYQQDGTYEIAPSKTLQLSVKKNGIEENAVVEFVVDGDATISSDGLLTANEDAKVQSKIKVYAKSGNTKSKEITIVVVDLVPTSIKLSADKTVVTKGNVNFSLSYTPTYATIKDYTLQVTKIDDEVLNDTNKNWVTFDGDVMTLTGGDEIPDGTKFEVTATLNGYSDITSKIVITKRANPENISKIVAVNQNIITSKDASTFASITAFDKSGKKVDVDLDYFSYQSLNEDVAIVSENGEIIPKGHGEATIEVRKIDSENADTTFKVYVMVTPENINIKNVKVDTFSYSKNSSLVLDIDATNSTYENKCSKVFDYKFEMVDGSFSGDDVATVSGGEITFNKTGKVKVTVVSNSSLNNIKTDSVEKSKEIIVDVNEGVNVHSVSEFVAYANQTTNAVANIASDLNLTSEENFGLVDGIYPSLEFLGDRVINGNGFVLSTLNLPLCPSENKGNDLLLFRKKTANTPFMVQINNFEVVGCGSLDGSYDGNVAANKGSSVLNASYEYCHTYRRGIRIYGDTYDEGRAYVKDLKLENVKVSGFDVGIRVEHAVDGYMSDINISKCFSNGMEFNQNTLTLNNVTLGQVGAFGIEITPDDTRVNAEDKTDIAPCAGAEYNEKPTLKLTGYIHSDNYNNGASTVYMQALATQLKGNSVPTVIDAIIKGTIDAILSKSGITDEKTKAQYQEKLTKVINKCVKNEKSEINFYLLIFVNKEKMTYDKGNTEEKFAKYTSNEGNENMINITKLLMNLATNPDDTTYQNYQYLQMDLDAGSDMGGNLGQVILVNQAYVESK